MQSTARSYADAAVRDTADDAAVRDTVDDAAVRDTAKPYAINVLKFVEPQREKDDFIKIIQPDKRRFGDKQHADSLKKFASELPNPNQQLFLSPKQVTEHPDGSMEIRYPWLQFPLSLLPAGTSSSAVKEPDTFTMLTVCQQLPDVLLVEFLGWLLWSVSELHKLGFYLRDLKLENIGCSADDSGKIKFCHIDPDAWWWEKSSSNDARACFSEMYYPYWLMETHRNVDRSTLEMMDWYACSMIVLVVLTYIDNRRSSNIGYASDLLPLVRALRRESGANTAEKKSFRQIVAESDQIPDWLANCDLLSTAVHQPSAESVFHFSQAALQHLFRIPHTASPLPPPVSAAPRRIYDDFVKCPLPPSKRKSAAWKERYRHRQVRPLSF